MALPERTLQQLVAYILGLSLKLARFQACMWTLQDALTALGHLHCIQTLGLRTEPGQEAAMRDISQENRDVPSQLPPPACPPGLLLGCRGGKVTSPAQRKRSQGQSAQTDWSVATSGRPPGWSSHSNCQAPYGSWNLCALPEDPREIVGRQEAVSPHSQGASMNSQR